MKSISEGKPKKKPRLWLSSVLMRVLCMITAHISVNCVCLQALAGLGILDNLHHRTPWYAETAGGVLALAAQLSSRDDLLLWRPGSRSPATKDHLSQEPHTGGTPLSPSRMSTVQCRINMPQTSWTDCFLSHQCHIKINSAYGSMKDISVYNMLGLSPSQIYIVGRPSKKYQNQCQVVQVPVAPLVASFTERFGFFFNILLLWSSDPFSVLCVCVVPEWGLRSAPLHPSIWAQGQTKEIAFSSDGAKERLLWSLSEARLPV